MKITLDLTDLVETGKLTAVEAERLRVLAAHDTSSLGINILVGFGVVAVAAGAGALLPSPLTAVVLGALVAALGFALMSSQAKMWDLLAQICIVIGALGFCGGLAMLDGGSLGVMLAVAVILAAAAVLARSGLLIASSVLVLGACLGSSSDYRHAMYTLTVEEPTLTIVVFSLIALAAYLVLLRVKAQYERLALIAARTAILMINFGFWVGSLWGDSLLRLRALIHNDPTILHDYTARSEVVSPLVFSLGWAVALVVAGAWAVKVNRRWIVNVAAVFAAIHFYTQWFEKLGANPTTVLLAGLLLLAFAFGLWSFNRRATAATA
jgi:iron complex transport system permease protein